jgi:hypothetical protein
MAAFAFLFQVAGALDGATVFTLPNPLPAPVSGVHVIPVAGAFGIWDPLDDSAFDTPTAYFVRSLHGEFSAATRFFNCTALIPGVGPDTALCVPPSDPSASPLMRLEMTPSQRVLPKGSRMRFLATPNANGTGTPPAGPHAIYVELETMDSEDDIVTVLEKEAADFTAFQGRIEGLQSFQAVAATLSVDFQIAPDASHFEDLIICNGAVAAAGESMTFEVFRVRGGVATSLMTAAAVIDSTDPANVCQSFANLIIHSLARTLNAATDTLRLVRTYVAGGGPTPMTNTTAKLIMQP